MKTLRKIHLYLGCVFAPLVIYFSLSGVWQVFRLNNLPKEGEPSRMQVVLHELSNPHTHSTLPGKSPKTNKSLIFNGVAVAMGAGLILTTMLGLLLAFKFAKNPVGVLCALAAGVVFPVLALFWAGG